MAVDAQSNGVQKALPSALPLVQKLSKDHDHVLKSFRVLIADLVQQFGGGHPGLDMIYICLIFRQRLIITVVLLAWPPSVLRFGNMSCAMPLTPQTSSIAIDLSCLTATLVYSNIHSST